VKEEAMSYDTKYDLTTIGAVSTVDACGHSHNPGDVFCHWCGTKIDAVDPVQRATTMIARIQNGWSPFASGEACSWYTHEDEMREVGRVRPDVVFALYGFGEDNGDMRQGHF
jgi:hypothetical protein